MNIRPVLILLTALLMPITAAASETKTVSVGQNFSLEMESNPTTGFKWQLAEPLDETVLHLVGNTYTPIDNPGPRPIVGSGGKEVWTFEAIGQGTAAISLKYARPWEHDASPAHETIYQITVE